MTPSGHADTVRSLAKGVALASLACLAYGIVVERDAFVLRRVTVPVLKAGQAPLRVLHLSDLHLTNDRTRLVRWVDGLAALRPDLVVNTGDNIGSAKAIGSLLKAYGRLFDTPGVFVFGSNDLYGPRPVNPLSYLGVGPTLGKTRSTLPSDELRDALTGHGWLDVEHVRTTLRLDGRNVEVRGTPDGHLDLDDYSRIAGPPAPGTDVSLLVTHAPYRRLLDAATRDSVDLLFAGHTHGGQVCVPWYGALTTNCDLETDRVKGLSRHDYQGRSSWLHVSAGLGTAPTAPFRFACRPEATLLTLVDRDVS